MGGVGRRLLQRLHDHSLDLPIADRPRLTRPRLIVQAVQPPLGETGPPFTHRCGATAQPAGDRRIRLALGAAEHDPAAQRQRLRALRPARPPLQRLPLLCTEHHTRRRTPSLRHHSRLPSSLLTTGFATAN